MDIICCRKMFRDEEVFPEPDRFYPERYLADVDEATARRMDPRGAVFGFGRRYVTFTLCFQGTVRPLIRLTGDVRVRTWWNRLCG